MTRIEIIIELKKYFKIQELVSRAVYDKFSNNSWMVFQTDALHCLLLMREGIGKPFIVNTWHGGGIYDERGFRENISSISAKKTRDDVLYVSGHVLGGAFDYKVVGMDAEDVRDWIVANADIFPCKIRLENEKNGVQISWVHFDIKFYENNPKVYLFNV